jgi:hypothetical protein
MSCLRVVVVLVSMFATSVVHAQSRPSAAFHEDARRAQLHDQAIAATALYVTSVAVGLYGGVTGGISLGGISGPACIPYESARCASERLEFGVLFWGGIAADILANVVFFVAVALDVDRRSRQHTLDRAVGRVRLVPGPGEVGLSLVVILDES